MDRAHALIYNRELIDNRAINASIGVLFFILATVLGAYVRIPVKGSPVPITLQTFFVILSGAILGKRLGSLSQFVYLILGTIGLPVFQGYSSGVAYILGPTGGYIIGFIVSAYFIGYMLRYKSSNITWVIASFVAGSLIICILGSLWLVYLYKINIVTAISIGILPFLPGDMIKIFFATIIYSKISQRSKTIFSV